MMKSLVTALMSIVLVACGATTQQTATTGTSNEVKAETPVTQSSQSENVEEVAKADDIVCTYQAKTGTRFKKKVCLPRAVRDRLREQAQTMMRNQSASQLPEKF